MAIEYFCCYHSYRRKIAKLSDQEVGRLFRALLEYSELGETQELAGREAVAFDFIADDIDRAKENYESKCKQLQANATKSKQMLPDASISGENKNKNKDENKNKNDIIPPVSPPKRQKAVFEPPTLAEVEAYCKERGNSVDAKRFFDYFEANDWKDAKGNPVKSWKQKVITWENYDTKPTKKSVVEQGRQSVSDAEVEAFMKQARKMAGGEA